ncbi:MAG: polyhydroxyalkanoic acid system family protein [Bacteriovoracaceae bacterium]|nr:polyhydroxyalkanoic acid system family protein [Bacteriovoracaceae bacterium]
MDLKVPYANVTDKKQAYEAAKKIVPEALAKFGVKADIKQDDASSKLTAKGSGFEAQIQFVDGEAQVKLDLGFLLKPLKGKVLEALERQIKKVV